MKLPYEYFIGLRYTRAGRRAGRRNGFISFISGLSVAGIALGVAALIIVLSVMNGFQKEVRDRMLSVLSHVEILAADTPLRDWHGLADETLREPGVLAAAPFVAGQAMLTREGSVRGIVVRGVDPAREPAVGDYAGELVAGRLDSLVAGEFHVVVGKELASQWLLEVGDRLTLIAPQGSPTPAGIIPRLRQFTISGIFASGHYEYDSNLVLVELSDAARLFRVDGVSGIRLRTDDMMRAPAIADSLARRLPAGFLVRDWTQENRNWFAATQIEKRMMFIILMLIVAVAAFNLVSMLVMTVTDKLSDIAILRTLGASPGSIMRIFITQGAAVGLLGTLAGVVLGVVGALRIGALVHSVERLLGFEVLPKGIYFINYLPSDLHVGDVLVIGTVACIMAFVATIYPSWRASRVRPAEALRYE